VVIEGRIGGWGESSVVVLFTPLFLPLVLVTGS